MPTIADVKELELAETPIFLFDCTLTSGEVHHWSTHKVTVNGFLYEARVLQQNLFEMRSSSDNATDGTSNISVTLANADSFETAAGDAVPYQSAQIHKAAAAAASSHSKSKPNAFDWRAVPRPSINIGTEYTKPFKDGWDEILKYQLDIRHGPCNFVELMPRLKEHMPTQRAVGAR